MKQALRADLVAAVEKANLTLLTTLSSYHTFHHNPTIRESQSTV
jgi:hypothetical protein